jgi:hypothetical protein
MAAVARAGIVRGRKARRPATDKPVREPRAGSHAGELRSREATLSKPALQSAVPARAKALQREDFPPALDFQKSSPELASSPAPSNFKFEREDWTLFRTVEGLQQKAGVPATRLRRLVLKEIADNALDTGTKFDAGQIDGHGFYIADNGPGLDGAPEDIARLFSIARPLVSTKLWRLPTRGALGNGLRVVAGAVLASGGSLAVITHDRRIQLRPERDGTTTVVSAKSTKFPIGTRIEIGFGPALPSDQAALSWARIACHLAQGTTYGGRSSPWWYDISQFQELLYASGDRPVRELIANLDGCTGGKAGEIVAAAGLSRAICKKVTRDQAAKLLKTGRDNARPVKPERLGTVGPGAYPDSAYAMSSGVAELDLHEAVDVLQADAVASGLVHEIGQDEVQRIIASAFHRERGR